MNPDFRVGDWQVHPDLNLIEQSGEERSLKPKAMEVLVYLAEHAGEVLQKERLIRAVWPDTFVTDDVLKQAIFHLRQALGDDSHEARYIQTIPKRGYCLIADVRLPGEDGETHPERYRLLQKLAEGGMGEIHLAEDTDLGRRVALKFLRQEAEEDEVQNRRFRREARAAAALDHPYICKVYETGILEGRSFIAMEYVEGETLKDRLRKGPRPLKEAFRFAREMAEALEAAHRHGIVHRDVKPSNVILAEAGHVKITDFGIAKRFRKEEGEPGDWTLTETTEETVGTPDFMSPEQIRGDPVDFRSDIFSFGIVLYEMVTGVHPFRKEKRADTTAAILQVEPTPLREHSKSVPELLEHILKKLLAKDPEHRSQSMRGVQNDLEQLTEDLERARIVEGPRGAPWFWKAAGAVTLLVLLVAALLYLLPSESFDSTSLPTTYEPIRLTSYLDYENSPSFSPDGSQIAYSSFNGWQEPGEPGNIYIKLVGAGDPIPVTDSEATDHSPVWSPDGRQIAFLRRDSTGISIWLVPALGGSARRLALLVPAPTSYEGVSCAWMPDGKWLVVTERKLGEPLTHLSLISVQTREKRQLTFPTGDRVDSNPDVSPDGSMLAFVRGPSWTAGDIYLLGLSQTLDPIGKPLRLTNQAVFVAGLTWTADGKRIIYSGAKGFFNSRLWITDIKKGQPKLLHLPGDNLQEPVVSRQGDRLAYSEMAFEANIYSLKLSEKKVDSASLRQVISSSTADLHPMISPDGTRIAFFSNRSGSPALHVSNLDGSEVDQLAPFGDGVPAWSPDGRQIAIESGWSKGQFTIYVVDVETGVPKVVFSDSARNTLPRFSRDGSFLYFPSLRSGRGEVWKVPAEGGQAVQVTEGTSAHESPDGRYLYFNRGNWLSGSLWRMPVEGGKEEKLLDLGKVYFFKPILDGVFFTNRGADNERLLYYLDPDSREVTPCGQIPADSVWFWDITPDGSEIFFSKRDRFESDIMLVENFR